MRKAIFFLFAFLLGAAALAPAQMSFGPRYDFVSVPTFSSADSSSSSFDQPKIDLPMTPLPRLAPELALQVFMEHTAQQSQRLAQYTDETVVKAELPDTSQKGEYELVRNYSSQPRSLTFKSVRFTGDNFVKTNVITRLLQSEVEHVEKGDPAASAISERNYKFSYKGTDEIDGRLMHVYQLKPRRKDPNLFKGRIFVDARTGSLRRAEGTVSKSPSFFIRKIEFVQEFQDISGFTVPVEMRSTTKARIIGKAIVSIFHRGYQLKAQAAPAPTNATLRESSN
jgi:hypothetical protein